MDCYCGGIHSKHKVGDAGCFRARALEPVRKVGGSKWVVGKETVTETTLFMQRRYHQHHCGKWSKPCVGDASCNSM